MNDVNYKIVESPVEKNELNIGQYHVKYFNNKMPNEKQTQLMQLINNDLKGLLELNEPGVITLYGMPGIGKTSIIKNLLENKEHLFVEVRKLKQLLNNDFSLNKVEQEFLVFDDINFELNDDNGTKQLIKILFNTEQLLNKHNKPLKIILISNESEFDIKKCFDWSRKEIFLRAESRMHSLMKSYNINDIEDFRAQSDKRGAFVGKIDIAKITDQDILEINIQDIIIEMKKNVAKEDYNNNQQLINSLIQKVQSATVIIIRFNEREINFSLESQVIMPILDHMESNVNVKIYFQCSSCTTSDLKNFVTQLFKNNLIKKAEQQKYLSRLNRLTF